MNASSKSLSTLGLTSIIFSAIIGSGLFHLPQTMAFCGGPYAILAGWTLTGLGITALSYTFLGLYQNASSPENFDLLHCIEAYWGKSIAQYCSWGYWCSAWIGNTAYLIMISQAILQALHFSTDHRLVTYLMATSCLAVVHTLVTREVHTLNWLHSALNALKLLLIGFALVGLIRFFDVDLFRSQFWHSTSSIAMQTEPPNLWFFLVSLRQVLSITLWFFLGFEGAILLAKKASFKRVAKGTYLALGLIWIIYVMTSLLPWGILPGHRLAELPAPSITGILGKGFLGPLSEECMNVGVVLFSLGALLAWGVFAVEMAQHAFANLPMPSCVDPVRFPKIVKQWSSTLATASLLLAYLLYDVNYNRLAELATFAMLPFYTFSAGTIFRINPKASRFLILAGCVGIAFLAFVWATMTIFDSMALSVFFLPLALWTNGSSRGNACRHI